MTFQNDLALNHTLIQIEGKEPSLITWKLLKQIL